MENLINFIYKNKNLIIIVDNENIYFNGLQVIDILGYESGIKILKKLSNKYKVKYGDIISDDTLKTMFNYNKELNVRTTFVSESELFR